MPEINKFNWGRFGKGIEIDQWIKVLAIMALRSEFDSDVRVPVTPVLSPLDQKQK